DLMLQQGAVSMAGAGNVPTNTQCRGTWSNTGVDISLDNLSLCTMKKAPAPSMNQLQTVSPTAQPMTQTHPGMLLGSQVMGGRMPAANPPMNGSTMSSVMMPGMIPSNVLPGSRMPMCGPGTVSAMPASMTPMRAMMTQQPPPSMSMPNLGL
ncbi:hypothetical protein OTU49_016769, partial [Cherax quadricarinatus]